MIPARKVLRKAATAHEVAVARAEAQAERRVLRELEHRIDVTTRLNRNPVNHGLDWREAWRGACWTCGREGRRWIGRWFIFEIEPEVLPYAIASTQALCGFCTLERQNAERDVPIWRPSIAAQRRTSP